MKGLKKISSRIFLRILIGTLIVFSLSSIIDYFYTKSVLQKLIGTYVDRSFSAAYNELNAEIIPILNNAENTVCYISGRDIDENSILEIQKKNRNKFTGLFSNSIIQYFKDKDELWTQYLSNDSLITEFDDSFIWCDILKLKNNQELGCDNLTEVSLRKDTISFFYYHFGINRNICVQYDFNLQKFIDILNTGSSLWPSRHYLFNSNNEALRSSTTKYIDVPDNVQEREISLIRNLIEKNSKGLILPQDLNYKRAIYLSKLNGSNLTIASAIQIDRVKKQFLAFVSVSYFISILAFILLSYMLQRIVVRITRPIEELTDLSKKIQAGSLNTIVPVYNKDGETAQLSDALRTVQSRMKQYVHDLNSTMKAKRAIEHELKVANKIQMEMIPDSDRALTELPEIDLYAKMIPAHGIAGDFYDYFFLDKTNLFFVIGDVSGKGIPAALFMVKTITLIEVAARKYRNPTLVFNEVNEHLCLKNDEGMFVTAICGIINIKSGELALCDAGHNTPIFSLNRSELLYNEINKGLPLGIMQDRVYSETKIQLLKKDTLIFYTDGFPECVGSNDSMLSEQALEESLKGKSDLSLNIIAGSLWDLIKNFRQGTPASDDTTLLIIRHFGN